MPDVHRADQQDDLVIEVDADLLHHVAGVHKRARLMMHGDREDAELRLTLETSAEDATTWEPESSTRAEALLRRLADRELRLEAAAARLGMTGELLLDSLASTTLPDEDAASSIPASELASLRLHLLEPRLARVACQSIAETRGLTAAKEVAGTVLAGRTTDPAYDELELWMTWHEQAAVATARAQQPRTITHRRLARPEGRVNPNPYLPR